MVCRLRQTEDVGNGTKWFINIPIERDVAVTVFLFGED